MQPSNKIEEAIKSRVHADLDPKLLTAYLKTGAAVCVGGVLSLFLCGQFGMGLTSTASSFNHAVHHGLGPWWCAAICGALFAIVPAIVLRLLSNPLQFRALLRKRKQPLTVWTITMGSLLSYHGAFGFEFFAVVIWSVTAYVVFRGVGEIVDRVTQRLQAVLTN